MALEFYRYTTNNFLFALSDKQFEYLADIFKTFNQYTGLYIDPYRDMKLTIENQQTLVKIINTYIDSADLNRNKPKTSVILEFKGVLNYFINHKIDLKLIGD